MWKRNHCDMALVKLPFTGGDKGSSELGQIFQPALAFHHIEPLSLFHARADRWITAWVQGGQAEPSHAVVLTVNGEDVTPRPVSVSC